MKNLILKNNLPHFIEVSFVLISDRLLLIVNNSRKDLYRPDSMITTLFFDALLKEGHHYLEKWLPDSDMLTFD